MAIIAATNTRASTPERPATIAEEARPPRPRGRPLGGPGFGERLLLESGAPACGRDPGGEECGGPDEAAEGEGGAGAEQAPCGVERVADQRERAVGDESCVLVDHRLEGEAWAQGPCR